MSNNQSQMTGAYGEALAVTELIKRAYVALNANSSVRNHRSIDIYVLDMMIPLGHINQC